MPYRRTRKPPSGHTATAAAREYNSRGRSPEQTGRAHLLSDNAPPPARETPASIWHWTRLEIAAARGCLTAAVPAAAGRPKTAGCTSVPEADLALHVCGKGAGGAWALDHAHLPPYGVHRHNMTSMPGQPISALVPLLNLLWSPTLAAAQCGFRARGPPRIYTRSLVSQPARRRHPSKRAR